MTKGDFARIPVLRREIERELLLWENALESATNISYALTGMPHGGGVYSKVEACTIKADEHYEKYTALCDELRDIWVRLKRDIKLCKLSEDEAKVLNMFYPQKRKVADIAKEMGKTDRQVFRIKKTAMAKICRIGLTENKPVENG